MKHLKQRLWRPIFAALAVGAMAFGVGALGQSFSIDRFVVAGGGGTSTNSMFSLTGTIGQPDAGLMSNPAYSLAGGFWGVVAAIQTPGAPLLSATNAGGTVVLSWLRPATGFVLEQSMSLASAPSPASWSSLAANYQTNATHIFTTVPITGGNRFFRLRK